MVMEVKDISAEEKSLIARFFRICDSEKMFCHLLTDCQRLLYQQKIVNIIPQTLKALSHPNSSRRFKTFEISKKNGGKRTIHAPKADLKVVLKCLNLIIHSLYEPHNAAYGFVRGKSVVDNAKLHSNSLYVFNIDLKDFFPSIEIGRILNRLNHPPFNLKGEGKDKIALYIAWLSCENMIVEREIEGKLQKTVRRVLPQGSPVSPIFTNIICERLDYLLSAVAKRFGAVYSRYADDITFSSNHNIYQKDGTFRQEVERIIAEQHFQINRSKVRLQKSNVRQEVTGITVNKEPNVARRYIKQIRMWLYFWETYGTDKAFSLFLKSYLKDKGHVKVPGNTPLFMEAVIRGKLDYLKMVKGESNSTYSQLLSRFEKVSYTPNHIDHILDVWENKGIETAIIKFETDG